MNIFLKSLFDLVYPEEEVPSDLPKIQPPLCDHCGEVHDGVIEDDFICANCQGTKLAFRKARAAYRSVDYVREVIHEFKYNQQFHRLPLLGRWIAEGFERFYSEETPFDALVPVPLYPARRRDRHFNQAEEIAKKLSKKTGIPVMLCLKRTKNTLVQARLQREQRFKNQLGAYEVDAKFDIKELRLLLIDDVLTTGATANACAHALLKKKAEDVCVLTVARG